VKRTMFRKIVKTLLVLLMVSGGVFGQEPSAEADKNKNQEVQPQETPAPVVDDGSAKVFLDKIEIQGRLEKPQAVFIVPGTNPEIDDINIERAFFNEIFRSMEKKGRAMDKAAAPGQERKDVIPW